MVSSEAAPLAKTGGLADVVAALPSALQEFGDQAAVVIPRYGFIDLRGARRVYDSLPVYLGTHRYDTSVYQAPEEYPLYLINCPPLFGRPGLYGEAGRRLPGQPHSIRRLLPRGVGCGAQPVPLRHSALSRLASRIGSGIPEEHLRHGSHFFRREDAVHHPQFGLPGAVSANSAGRMPQSTPRFIMPEASNSSGRSVISRAESSSRMRSTPSARLTLVKSKDRN